MEDEKERGSTTLATEAEKNLEKLSNISIHEKNGDIGLMEEGNTVFECLGQGEKIEKGTKRERVID